MCMLLFIHYLLLEKKTKKCVSTSQDKELLEKCLRWWKKMVSTSKHKAVFKKWFPHISLAVSTSRKELSSTVSNTDKNLSPVTRMRGFVKKYVSIRREKGLWFALDRKSVSTTRNKAFVEKYVSTMPRNCFFWQKNRKWFQLAEKNWSVKIVFP